MKARQIAVVFTSLVFSAQPLLAYEMAGIIDPTGKTIVPCEYHNIESLGHGLFYLEHFDKDNPKKRSYSGHLIDHDGQTIKVNIPAGTSLAKVLLSPDAYKFPGLWSKLPDGTILLFKNGKDLGICRLDGEVILDSGAQGIGFGKGYEIQKIPFGPGYEPQMLDPNLAERMLLSPPIDNGVAGRIDTLVQSYLVDFRTNLLNSCTIHPKGHKFLGFTGQSTQSKFPSKFAYRGKFSQDGLAAVQKVKDGPMFYIDSSGKQISPIDYYDAKDFIAGHAIVAIGTADNKKYGLIDNKFNFVLPAKYHWIEHLFDQTYCVIKNEGDCGDVITPDGKTVFKFPDYVQSYNSKDGDLIVCQMKADNPKDQKAIYFDNSGRQVVFTKLGRAQRYGYGLASRVTSRRGPRSESQIEDSSGKVILPAQPGLLCPLSEDRILKMVTNDRFNSNIFKNPNPDFLAGIWRFDDFGYLLADYDLIGMPQNDLEKLIGLPNEKLGATSVYAIAGEVGVVFEYDGGKVIRWREINKHLPELNSNWVTTNVIYDPQEDRKGRFGRKSLMQLVPKPSSVGSPAK